MSKPYVIAIYMRVSAEDHAVKAGHQDESQTIGNQRSILYSFIAERPEFQNSEIVQFCDDGFSGVNFQRPAIKALLADIKSKKIDCMIVKDFSRFGRDYLQVSDYVDQIFPFLGMRFISVNDGYDSSDYAGVTSGVDIAFRNVVYAYYSRDLSEKVRSGLRVKAQRGEFISPFAPFGYKKDEQNKNHLVAEECSAKVVKRIFGLAGAGMSTLQIAYLLNSEGVPTPSRFKQKQGLYHKWWDGLGADKTKFWSHNGIADIIRDERYLGKAVYGKQFRPEVGNMKARKSASGTWIIVPNCHEPLVTLDEFQMAQRVIGKTASNPLQWAEKHLFAGKLRCGVCGYALCKSESGKMKYHCRTKSRTAAFNCMEGKIYANDLTVTVWSAIMQYCRMRLEQQTHVKKGSGVPEQILKLQSQLASYQTAVKKINEEKAALYETMLDGGCDRAGYIWNRDVLSGKKDELDKAISGLEEQIVSLRQENAEIPQIQMVQNCLQSEHLTREILNAFVDCIYVHSDKSIEIRWLFESVEIMDRA